MKKNVEFVNDYLKAFHAMREQAEEVIKNYGKELDVIEILKQRIMEEYGYKSEDEIHEDVLEDCIINNAYYCIFEDKHGSLYNSCIHKIRYDAEKDEIEVYLKSDEGCIDDWYPRWCICSDMDAVYQTILEFID